MGTYAASKDNTPDGLVANLDASIVRCEDGEMTLCHHGTALDKHCSRDYTELKVAMSRSLHLCTLAELASGLFKENLSLSKTPRSQCSIGRSL